MRISNKALDSELGKVIHREVIENRLMGGVKADVAVVFLFSFVVSI